MLRFLAVAVVVAVAGGLIAAPPPAEPDVKKLVAVLGDPDQKVRDDSAAALKGRADALPWLRRAARSADKDTARRASDLLAPHEKNRQGVAAEAVDACIRDGRMDLLTEWHQYWQPEKEDDLWAVGPRAAKAGLDLLAKTVPAFEWKTFEKRLASDARLACRAHDGPCPERRFPPFKGTWTIRTDRMDRLPYTPTDIRFASVGGPISLGPQRGGGFLALGQVQASTLISLFLACDGEVWYEVPEVGAHLGVNTARSVVVCRGNFTGGSHVGAVVLLVDGGVDLTRAHGLRSCLIRASGEVRLPQRVSPEICTIEDHAKDATAPYKFFELPDAGLSVADDEEGLVVTGVKPGTPFGECGLAKGDLIRAADDEEARGSESLRKLVRRALVRQGDCLLTVARGDKALDLPVFFPTPK